MNDDEKPADNVPEAPRRATVQETYQAGSPPGPGARPPSCPSKRKLIIFVCVGIILLLIIILVALVVVMIARMVSNSSDKSDYEAPEHKDTYFSKDKQAIDSACGRQTLRADQGQLCKEACVPQYFKCCNPFDEFDLYSYTTTGPTSAPTTDTNTTDTSISTDTGNNFKPNSIPRPDHKDEPDSIKQKNSMFLEGHENFDDSTCSFDTEVRGCMSYAKCQAITGQIDPAPANLPAVCSLEQLVKDDASCKDLCSALSCCYSLGSDNCLAENFDLCMDYAPCQNLKSLEGYDVLPTAPHTLDFDCYWQQVSCNEACEAARCCSEPGADSCLYFNFMSCLTYSPCNGVTEVAIELPPQFTFIAKPPSEIIYACNAKNENVIEHTQKTCQEYCKEAMCCWDSDPKQSCFPKDPLGCLAWDAQCQVLLNHPDHLF